MTRSVPHLTILTCLVLAGAALAQPSVLVPNGAPPEADPMATVPPMGQMHLPAAESYSDSPELDGCVDDSWYFGPHRPRITGSWGSLESQLVWSKGRYLTALATTSTNPADRGVINAPTTTTLFGQQAIGSDAQLGARITAGVWLNPSHCTGVGVRFWGIEGDRTAFDRMSNGSTVLARPFINATSGLEDAILIAQPGVFNGGLHIQTENDFINTEAFARFYMAGDYACRTDLIAGYQFARVDDSLRIFSTTNAPLIPTTFHVLDQFSTENEFHGGLIGIMRERTHGSAKISWFAKTGFGSMRQQVTIAGGGDSGGVPLNGGLFAQQTNIGTYTRNRFAFLPEAGLNLHYRMTERLDFSLGYSFLWISSVALSGDQMDRTVNLTQQTGVLVGPARPDHTFNVTDYWLQSMNFGVNYAF